MSGSRNQVPAGLDSLSADESKLLDQMRAADVSDPSDLSGGDPAPSAPQPRQAPAAQAPAPVEIVDEEEDDGAGDAPPAGDNRSRTVPHQQFHAERERRKAAEAKQIEIERNAAAERARLEERVNMIVAAAQASAPPPAAPPPEPELPDVNVDPIGHFRELSSRLAKKVEAIEGGYSAIQQQQQRAAETNALRQHAAAQELAFEAQEPTYREAMKHLEQSRRNQLVALGITDPNQQAQVFAQDVQQIAARSRQDGANFAERLYNLAQQMGYQKAPPAAPVAPAIPPIDDVTIPNPVAAATRIQNGRDNGMTIGSAGTAPPTRISAAKIADMSDADFAVMVERMKGNPNALRDLMGH